MVDLGEHQISDFSADDLLTIANAEGVNSIRLYQADVAFDQYQSSAIAVVYPQEPVVLDALDLAPKVKHWINTTPQTMGNWTSKETVMELLESINCGEIVPVYVHKNLPLAAMSDLQRENKEIVAIGFDTLQLPRYKITFKF